MTTRVDPMFGYGQYDDGTDMPAPDPIVATIERIMGAHLPVRVADDAVLCMGCLELPRYFGPVYHRWHVAELIRDALRETNREGTP